MRTLLHILHAHARHLSTSNTRWRGMALWDVCKSGLLHGGAAWLRYLRLFTSPSSLGAVPVKGVRATLWGAGTRTTHASIERRGGGVSWRLHSTSTTTTQLSILSYVTHTHSVPRLSISGREKAPLCIRKRMVWWEPAAACLARLAPNITAAKAPPRTGHYTGTGRHKTPAAAAAHTPSQFTTLLASL